MKWWQETVVYEVYPKSFLDTAGQGTGTLRGVTAKLGYLKSLGVGAVWLTPVYLSPMVDNGYDVADYYRVDPSWGTMDDMDELIGQARELGIRIVMDLVFNHTSDQCPWFVESRSSRDGAKSDWYIWRDAATDGGAPTNWRGIFGGSAWTWCEKRGQYYLHTFAEQQPDLNWENPDVRAALYDIANFWADKGVGGFRVDAITYIKKPALLNCPPDAEDGMARIHDATANTPGILDFLREFRENVCTGRDIFMVGEANGVHAEELPDWVGEHGVFDMLFEFSHVNLPAGNDDMWVKPGTWTLPDLKRVLAASQQATARNGWCPLFFENHDQPRSVVNFLPGCTDAASGAKALGCILYTMRGTPFVYQGEELGMGNVAWPDISCYDDISSHNQYSFALSQGFDAREALAGVHRFSRDNARTPMQWNAGPNAGFSDGTPWLPVHDDFAQVNVAVQEGDPNSVLSWYRRLAQLRTSCPELVGGDWELLMPQDGQVFAFTRSLGELRALVLANLSGQPATFDPSLLEGLSPTLCSHEVWSPAGMLAPYEAQIWRR